MKNKSWYLAALVLAAVFIFYPRTASDLVITVSFWEVSGSACTLYYTTDTQPEYCEELTVASDIDYDKMQVSFRLDGALETHLTGLRLDFPEGEEQLLDIKAVTISSAGVIQKDFNPCIFFAEENLVAANDLDLSVVDVSNKVYVSIRGDDPYLVFSESLVEQVTRCYSHQAGSRLLVCVFLAACYVIARHGIFKEEKQHGIQESGAGAFG